MPRRPDELLRTVMRKIKLFAYALKRRPSELSLWATGQSYLTTEVADRLRSRRVRKIPHPVSCLHEEHVHAARASGRSVIFVSVHSNYYHFSMSWFYNVVKTQGWAIHSVTSGGHPNTVQSYERVFSSVILSTTEVRKATRVLQRGEGIVLLQDSFAEDGVPIQLYDRVAPFRLGAARLAEMTDSLILPYIALSRRGEGLIHWWPPIDPREGNTQEKLADAMARMIHTYPRSWSRLARLINEYEPQRPQSYSGSNRLMHDQQ